MRNKLKEKRIDLNLNQQLMSERINISRSYYTRIESGSSNPTYKLAIKIKEAVEYYDDDLFENAESND